MNKTLSVLSLAFLLISTRCMPQSDQGNSFDLEYTQKTLSAEISKILQQTGIPSVSIALIRGDELVWSEAFGFANVKMKVPATNTTIYSTGSNFKFVTATAVMQLQEAGKLSIDDPVNEHLGDAGIADMSAQGQPVTFRHLLSHHSGLKGPIEIIPIWERKLPKGLDQIANEISVEEAPGKNYKYCNHCYALAGLAIETLSGKSYQDYIVEHILKPLSINAEGPVVPTPDMVEELALPYAVADNKSRPVPQSRFDVFPAGDIYLTPSQMANFLIAQLNEGQFEGTAILSAESTAAMQEAQFGGNYGLGTGVIPNGDKKFLQHSGGVPGFSTLFKVETNSKVGYYLASNAGGVHGTLGIIGELALELLKGSGAVDPLPPLVFEEIDVSEDILRKYEGKYELQPGFVIAVTRKGRNLYAQATGQDNFQIFPYEQAKFFYKVVFAQIQFNMKEDKAVSLTLFQNGEVTGKRID